MSAEDWMRAGLCNQMHINPDLFFPIGRGRRHHEIDDVARRICNACLVRDYCEDYAVENNIQDGIWGGKSSKERRDERRKRILLSKSLPDESS